MTRKSEKRLQKKINQKERERRAGKCKHKTGVFVRAQNEVRLTCFWCRRKVIMSITWADWREMFHSKQKKRKTTIRIKKLVDIHEASAIPEQAVIIENAPTSEQAVS